MVWLYIHRCEYVKEILLKKIHLMEIDLLINEMKKYVTIKKIYSTQLNDCI